MIFKSIAVLAAIQIYVVHLSSAQFLTFKDGKIGVNFGGYHAAAGLGGGPNGGFLAAEAGTPYGPAARAGLGGGQRANGRLGGNLYADATAGGGIKAGAGLGGSVDDSERPSAGGALFAGAQASDAARAEAGLRGHTKGGEHPKVSGEIYSGARLRGGAEAEAGLGGKIGPEVPSGGYTFSKTVVPSSGGRLYQTKFVAPPAAYDDSDEDDERREGAGGAISGSKLGGFKAEAEDIPAGGNYRVEKTRLKENGIKNRYQNEEQNEVIQDKYETPLHRGAAERQPQQDNFINFEKSVRVTGGRPIPDLDPRDQVYTVEKIHRHHKHPLHVHRKTVIFENEPAPPPSRVEVYGGAPAGLETGATYQKTYAVGGNTFFEDIANIPISTLRAVSGFLSNNFGRSGAVRVHKSIRTY